MQLRDCPVRYFVAESIRTDIGGVMNTYIAEGDFNQLKGKINSSGEC